MTNNCISCDKNLDPNQDNYIIGESLGENWCDDCVNKAYKTETDINKRLH